MIETGLVDHWGLARIRLWVVSCVPPVGLWYDHKLLTVYIRYQRR